MKIDCHRCRYFYVAWDPSFPWGCRAMGFKSRELPSSAVRASSGMECLRFAPRGSGMQGRKRRSP